MASMQTTSTSELSIEDVLGEQGSELPQRALMKVRHGNHNRTFQLGIGKNVTNENTTLQIGGGHGGNYNSTSQVGIGENVTNQNTTIQIGG